MIEIQGKKIGPGEPVYIVAEASCNHMGDLQKALALIDAAKAVGADAVKFQCYEAWEMADPNEREVIPSGPWAGLTLYELYKQAETPRAFFPHLFGYAKHVGITCFASVFSPDGVDFLETLGCPAYKIASGEAEWYALFFRLATTGKPVLASNVTSYPIGMPLVRLHCIPEYPAPLSQMNLTMARCGLSDHSMSHIPAQMAVALGACVIEHHLMLAGTEPLDKGHSWTPAQFGDYVKAIRVAESIMGDGSHPEPDRTFLRRQLPDGRWLRSLAPQTQAV